jgi:hypothetical protein
VAEGRTPSARFFYRFYWGGIMSHPLNRAEQYRYLANHHRRLASNDSFKEARNYHLYMAKNFSALAAAAGAEEPMNRDGSDLTDGVSRTRYH